MNAIKAFPQINAEYAYGIRPNQRRMRAWHSAGRSYRRGIDGRESEFPPTMNFAVNANNFTRR